MSTVIETLGKYEVYLKEEKLNKDSTIRKINLSLSYFTELYGITDTKDLKAVDLRIFYQWLKERPCKRKKHGVITTFGSAHLEKVMIHVKAYIKWLADHSDLGSLVPADVRRGKVIEKIPSHLTEEEMSLLVNRLENDVMQANLSGDRHKIYNAYLWRAVVWMLYTAGLRNFELRSLTYEDITISQLCGTVLGKGDRFGVYTFSTLAGEKLKEYLAVRDKMFPETNFKYLFTLYKKGKATPLVEQTLNNEIREIAIAAGIKQRVHAHLFRHTMIMHLLAAGWSIVDVMRKARHKSLATTSLYVSSNTDLVQEKTKPMGEHLLLNGPTSLISAEFIISMQQEVIMWLMDERHHKT